MGPLPPRSPRGLRSDRVSALSERHHQGERRHGRQESAEDPNAESEWILSSTAGVEPVAEAALRDLPPLIGGSERS